MMLTITEDDIYQWASYVHDAEDVLPDLIRRILYALLPGANLSFPAYRATNLGGYDGVLITSSPTLFSDTQTSVWELSVREDVTTKANSDYNTRTANPLGKDKANTTYIALNGRRWANKEKWVEDKKKEGQWADVRAYDATDIAQWLTQTLPTSIWFMSEILGRSVDGITSLNHYFREWSYRTQPALQEAIILAGRDEQVQVFHNWLSNKHKSLSIRAETIEECIIFSCAAILTADEPERDDWIARTLVIASELAWERIIKATDSNTFLSPLILFPGFDEFDGSTAISQQHYLLLPSETGQIFKDPDILLYPIPRGELAEELTAIVSSKDSAEKLAYDSGGKVTALQRLLGYTRKLPTWVNQSSNLHMGLLLAGMWHPGNVNDQAIVSELCMVDTFDQLENHINILMTIPDAPLRRQGGAIKWRSIKDGWQLLASKVTTSDLQRFKAACIHSLKKYDPRYDLALEDRMFAGIYGNTLAESGYIRRGISESLAWLAFNKEEIEGNLGAYSVSNVVDEVVRTILDGDWKVWATLGESLSNFAEASPDEFLRSVDKAIKAPEKNFEQLFNQDPKNSGMSAECCHSGLLWALEILAWSPKYFPRVASLLAALCEIDPGGQYANRPKGSLLSIFHPLSKQTPVPNNQREATLRGIAKRYTSCTWPLLQNLIGLCSRGGIITPNARPKFNDWVLPETFESYSYQEITDYFEVLRALLLENLESNLAGLVELLENQDISILASDLLEIIESNLEDFKEMEFQLRYRMQNALRNLIARRQITQEAQDENNEIITRTSELIDLLEADDQAENFAWLFPDSYLELPEPREWDWKKREEHIASLRENAILELLKLDSPLQQIVRLSKLSKNPRLVGLILGRMPIASRYQQEILENFLPQKDHVGEFALGFVASSYLSNGFDWLKSVVQNLYSEARSEEAMKVLTTVSSTPEIRDFVTEQSENVSKLYWKSVPYIDNVRDNNDFSVSIANLLDANRWYVAIMFAVSCLSLEPSIGKANDYLKILEHGQVASVDETKIVLQNSGSWRIAQIFKHLDSFEDADVDILARLEVFYIEILDRSERPPIYITRQIEQNPEFFAELLSLAFKARNESWDDFSDEEVEEIRRLANIASKIRRAWKGYPGIEAENEEQRDQTLRDWCQTVLELTEKADRKIIGQQMIGEVLSRAPAPKKDGIWPCLVAREYIEDGYDEIAAGLEIARYNARGVTSRALDAGGQQEREIAKKYREDAEKLQYEWFKTSSFLMQLAEKYERDATWNDADSEKYIDP